MSWSMPLWRFVVLASVLVMAGCASSAISRTAWTVPLANDDEDAQAKTFLAPPGKASIYLYRDGFVRLLEAVNVTLDGRPAGVMRGKTFFVWAVEPGLHLVEVGEPDVVVGSAHLTVEAGRNYYLWHELVVNNTLDPNPPLSTGSRLYRVDKDIGQRGVLRCKRLEQSF